MAASASPRRGRRPARAGGGGRGCRRLFAAAFRLAETFIHLAVFVLVAGVILLGLIFWHYSHDLPALEGLETYAGAQGGKWSQATQVLAADGTLLGEFYEEDRTLITVNQVPKVMRQAIIAVEDERFDPQSPDTFIRNTAWLRNAGIDPVGLARAIFLSATRFQRLRATSTITQQLARNLFLTDERSLKRKVQEIILSYQIERKFSRDEILERYLNKIFFGNQAYGLHSAALRYFGVDLRKPGATLTLGQAAILAGLAKAPSTYAPHKNRKNAERRMSIVLYRMVDCGYITTRDSDQAFARFWKEFDPKKVNVPASDTEGGDIKVAHAGFFLEHIRQELLKHLTREQINRGGYRVHTTLQPRLQGAAEAAMRQQLDALSKGMPAKLLAPGPLQGALVALDTQGRIVAMIGGREWSRDNQFNRAVQARRQAGSAFKPFVYCTALEIGATSGVTEERGATLATVLRDEPFAGGFVPGTNWAPQNYDAVFNGPVLPRLALAKSLNVAAVRMLLRVDPDPEKAARAVINLAARLGLNTVGMQPYPSIVLGAVDVAPIELAAAYSSFINTGDDRQPCYYEPWAITEIYQNDGALFRSFQPLVKPDVLSPPLAFLMRDILRSVVQAGTAAGSVGGAMGGIPAAGKTGTTDDYADAWFVGFAPHYTAAVWVGFDERRTMGRGMSGGHVAGPIWAKFMRQAESSWKKCAFPPMPDGVYRYVVCGLSGLTPSPDCPANEYANEYFARGTGPSAGGEICRIHSDPLAMLEFKFGDSMPIYSDTATGSAVLWPDTAFVNDPLSKSRQRLHEILDNEAGPSDSRLTGG